jgi:hypothetical protein
MKPKPNKRIDKLLGELGLHPDALDPDEAATDLENSAPPTPTRLTGPCEKSCYSSETNARKSGNRIKSHGANTSFFRSYFCPECKAWHLTSSKNIGSSKSSGTTRNAGRNRRNHPQSPSTDES